MNAADPIPNPALPTELLRRLADAATMKEMDRHAIEDLGLPGVVLMENAARSVVDQLDREVLRERPKARIVVCCGKGNNGGDGFAAARLLANRGYRVTVVDAGEAQTPDARHNQKLWQHFGESVSYPSPDATRRLEKADVILDAIFGIGLERPVEGAYREWIETMNANEQAIRVALDVPSGVSSDDSRVMGLAVQCHFTISFQFGKPGCFQQPGSSYCGRITVPDISITPKWPPHAPQTWRLTRAFTRALLPPLPADGHKGTFGHLLTVCGSAGMGGAALLASLSALKNGAGLVTACVPGVLRDRLPGGAPELMTLSPPGEQTVFREEDSDFVENAAHQRSGVVLGCGLGRHPDTENLVRQLLPRIKKPLVLDADGLNAVTPDLLRFRDFPTILTPHPGELARLSGLSVEGIQVARLETVRRLAQEWKVVLVLKGAQTVIGDPEGRLYLNPTGNVGLATAGSGDVLAGVIGSFLAQGLSPVAAALAGVYLHGAAADSLVREGLPPCTLTASDLFRGLGLARQRLST